MSREYFPISKSAALPLGNGGTGEGNEKVRPGALPNQAQQLEWNPATINCVSNVSIGDTT
jgi:hypothetical protein